MVYSAQDEPAPTGEEYWRDVIDRTIGPMDVRFPAGVDERERIVTGQVGALSIAAWETGPGEVFHTRAMLGGRIRVFYMFVHGRGRVVP